MKNHGDAQYSVKTTWRKYQVVLSSFKGCTFVDFIDPALIREYYERNLEGCYVKYSKNPLMLDVRKLSGNGLLFSEGVEYKHKKKIMMVFLVLTF
jgi:hypothetical protein